MDKKGYYNLLNITNEATADEIKIAYRIKAKELHPDKNRDFNTTKQFQQLNEAYIVLSDEKKRQEYDSYISILFDINFPREEISESEFKQYDINIDNLTCSCDDWVDNRSKYPNYDPRKLCKHLVYKLFSTDLPEEFKPFKDYLKYRKSTFRGVKLFQEIVFLQSSIVVIDYYGTHLYLYLKKQKDMFCSYKVFEVHNYEGVGYKWMNTSNELNDGEILYADNIDGKDYINKRFNVINGDTSLCNHLYKRYLYEEEYRIMQEYKSEYEITSKILIQIKSKYTVLSFNKKLNEMGYIVKSIELNKNNWILQQDGLKYGINYIIDSILPRTEIPSWYISTFFDSKTMSHKHEIQASSINRTNIMWEKKKFNELLKIMDEYKVVKVKNDKSLKQQVREEWLKDVSCHHCSSKNIHKKNKRVYGYGTVQRYQCMDCKSIFQEKVDENLTEENYIANTNLSEDTFEKDREKTIETIKVIDVI